MCSNCGQTFQGNRCPNCGKAVRTTGNAILAVIMAIFVMLPLGLFGACSGVLGVMSLGSRGSFGEVMPLMLMAAAGIGAAIGVGVLVRNLWNP